MYQLVHCPLTVGNMVWQHGVGIVFDVRMAVSICIHVQYYSSSLAVNALII